MRSNSVIEPKTKKQSYADASGGKERPVVQRKQNQQSSFSKATNEEGRRAKFGSLKV